MQWAASHAHVNLDLLQSLVAPQLISTLSSQMHLLRYLIPFLVLAGCSSKLPPGNSTKSTGTDSYQQPCLVDITKLSSLDFVHDPGDLDGFSMPQIMGSGAAFFDIDGDQDLDLLLIGGKQMGANGSGGDRLYRQEAGGKFADITEWAGIATGGYGMGVAVGDIDNDGDLDFFLTRYGADRLFQNRGDGRFDDITEKAGITNLQWGTAASFVDFDRDGWLDLFIANYVDFYPGSVCEDGSGRRDFCGPESLSGTVGRLYRNLGKPATDTVHSQFEDITVPSGIARRVGKGLGVLCKDFNGDGLMDIFVANDGEENFLWVQYENKMFSNEAILRGVALNRFGEAQANMGVVSEDLNNDGLSDLFVTHLAGEYNTLFQASQVGQFSDRTVAAGLSLSSLPFTGFGVAAADFDHDGDVDLAIANGGVKRGRRAETKDVNAFWSDYAQHNEFYLNDGKGGFESQRRLGGSDFTERTEVSRSLIHGDIDNDGDVDFLVTNCAGPARLYRNDFPKLGNWLSIAAIDPLLKRSAIGAEIQIQVGERVITRDLNPSSGYLGCSDMRVHVGLGKAARYDAIRVYWPNGGTEIEEFPGGDSNQTITVKRGSGRILAGDKR